MMRAWLLLLVGVGLNGALAAPEGAADAQSVHKRTPTRADSELKQGSYRQAAQSFRAEIAQNPDSVPSHLGLGRALTRLGRCDLAMAEFWPYVGMKAFSSDVAMAASVCSGRLGYVEDAILFSQLAVERNPANTVAMTNLVLSLDTAGRTAELDALLDELAATRGDRDASFYARLVLALRRGDLDEFDILAREWPTDRETRLTLLGLVGQSWLDSDDPNEVTRVMRAIKRVRRPGLARFVNAEGARRQGEIAKAADILEGRNLKLNQTNDSDAIRVRVLADEGDFDGARAILDSYDLGTDADLVASAWYLAWHEEDTAEMARLRDLYLTVRVSPLRNLYKLIPVVWRLDYVPGQPLPRPPSAATLRAAAAVAEHRTTANAPPGAPPPGVRPGAVKR